MAETVSAQIAREQAAVIDRVFNERLAKDHACADAEITKLQGQVEYLKHIAVQGGRYHEETDHERMLESFDIDGIVKYIEANDCKNIVVMCGAGISTSAGIPDFRTRGSGLYDNLQKYDLPEPEAVFTLSYFRETPEAFYTLAKEMWPDNFTPTPTHHFISELHKRGMLLRCYTQNIDSLENRAGLPADKIVAAHGNFDTASTIGTLDHNGLRLGRQSVPVEEVRAAIENGADEATGWPALAVKYGSLVKPDITFFGEPLPSRFFDLQDADLMQCDLLIIMGTSLSVAPFNKLIKKVGRSTPRLLINREEVGGPPRALANVGLGKIDSTDLDLRSGFNYRDAFCQGSCDDAVMELASKLGWGDVLSARVRAGLKGKPVSKPMGKPSWLEQQPKRQRTWED